jgi:hypothetical protein
MISDKNEGRQGELGLDKRPVGCTETQVCIHHVALHNMHLGRKAGLLLSQKIEQGLSEQGIDALLCDLVLPTTTQDEDLLHSGAVSQDLLDDGLLSMSE